MIYNTSKHADCALRPGTFSGLMDLYERNWELFNLLAPALSQLRAVQVSRVHADCDVYLQVVQRTTYTTTVLLTYLFEDEGQEQPFADPDITLRVYQDTAQVAVMRCAAAHRHARLREITASYAELEQSWRRNLLLNKWLDYLLDCGHLFLGLESQRSALPAMRPHR